MALLRKLYCFKCESMQVHADKRCVQCPPRELAVACRRTKRMNAAVLKRNPKVFEED